MTAATARQQGFGLVELMIGLVISLLLLAGVLQILLSNRQSYDAQRTIARLQGNARLASFVMEHALAQAGHRNELIVDRHIVFPQESGAGYIFFADGVVASNSGGANANDAIAMRFEPGSGVMDCRGSRDRSRYELAVVDDALQCRNLAGTDRLLDNVERLRVIYGVDSDGDRSVDAYTRDLTAATQPQVVSVRMQLLLVSDTDVAPSPVEQEFLFADGSTLTTNDRRLRRMIDQTVALRNSLP